ncbi:hypothetical protein [Pseudonocardia charpentierae]|uniref:Membrane protein involved in the export of O-antigen and teichoic acid n=1 Tax=Pseudonocardia charpentierae TaxID=3075545 RepID=A0ABU2NAN2_9PSEU|nr:hypothetical protein [Pseudonocardia sp. DSM 45834]MDT0350324.1 hypothetical protein [Pseudonocardia sp. DSM 45834]
MTDHPQAAHARTVLDHAVASSVDVLEAAVVLESQGVNDRVARDVFGVADVVTLAEREIRAAGPDRTATEPEAAPPAPAELSAPPGTRWFHVRGILYAVPMLVALALVPAVDPIESALVLGGLVVSWAWSYGVASVAWAYLGDRDPAAARRFLRRSLLVGVVLAVLVATVAVYAALILTATTEVTLATVLLLAGQSAYLMAAAVLLMTGHELLLLVALLPALAALALDQAGRQVAALTGIGPLHWIGGSVALAGVFALVATRGAARPVQRLGAPTWMRGLQQFGFGLLVALLVLFPAVNELVVENYDALPLSVTLAALPLVLAMGVAEGLLHRYRARTQSLLDATSSATTFARAALRTLRRYQLVFAGSLVALSALVGGAVAALSGAVDTRYLLLALDYAVIGPALFAAMLLSMLGRAGRVLEIFALAVVALAAFELHAAVQAATDIEALIWFGVVGAATLLVLLVLVRRCVVVPVHHR